MELVFIDSEPPGPAGGGIRTYMRLALDACRNAGVPARIYTHTPEAYSGQAGQAGQTGYDARPIGRKAWLPFPLRGLAYRLLYHENILWEHARWLADELGRLDKPGTVYEFCDFQGYAYFALRGGGGALMAGRVIVRVHTPAFLTVPKPAGLKARLARASLAFRERDCLLRSAQVTAPSAAFAAERLPWLKSFTHLPNPLPAPIGDGPSRLPGRPPAGAPSQVSGLEGTRGPRILYLGRIEPRKGVLTLLAGFLRLAKDNPDVTLAAVGASPAGPYPEKVRTALAGVPEALRARVSFRPPCPPEGLADLLSGFDILAVPSLWENSPYVYFEGMAAGLLCVGSATGEMKEAAAATGGFLAAPADPGDWTRALGEACAAWADPGRRAALLAAQDAYLGDRRSGIPGRMLDYYRKAAGEGAGDA